VPAREGSAAHQRFDLARGDRHAAADDLAARGGDDNVVLDPARHPKTIAYVERILARPSFAPMIEQETRFLERTAA